MKSTSRMYVILEKHRVISMSDSTLVDDALPSIAKINLVPRLNSSRNERVPYTECLLGTA
jgi:hypothetical protein